VKGKEKWEICVDDEMGNGNKEAKTLTQPGGPTCSHDLRGILGPFHFHKPFFKTKTAIPPSDFLCFHFTYNKRGNMESESVCEFFCIHFTWVIADSISAITFTKLAAN